jgi:4a-hydroxytetrahydrobiopterin dehydratase
MTKALKPLESMRCVPCEDGSSPLHGGSLTDLKSRLGGNWTVINEHHLEKTYRFKNFREALDFTHAVGELAEQEGHHPEITLTWGRVTVRIWTHKVDGLTENDFVLAAKAEQAFVERGKAAP